MNGRDDLATVAVPRINDPTVNLFEPGLGSSWRAWTGGELMGRDSAAARDFNGDGRDDIMTVGASGVADWTV